MVPVELRARPQIENDRARDRVLDRRFRDLPLTIDVEIPTPQQLRRCEGFSDQQDDTWESW